MVKDILREIKGRKLQFMAILLITTLGVGFFIGIRVTGHDMRLTADTYMESANVLDLEVLHTLAVDDEMLSDLDEVLNSTGLKSKSADAYAKSKDFDKVIHLYEYNEASINDLTLDDGVFPQNKDEAVIDSLIHNMFDINIGDEITIRGNDVFETSTLKVVGIGKSALYFNKSRGYTSLGSGELSGFIYAKDLDTKIDESTSIRYNFDEDVDVAAQIKKIEAKSDEISKARFERLIAPEREKLADAKLELEAARAKGQLELQNEKNKIAQAERDLEVAHRQLVLALDQLTFGIPTSGTLDERLDLVDRGFDAVVNLSQTNIDVLKARVAEIENEEVKAELQKQIDVQVSELEATKREFEQGFAQVSAGITEYNNGVAALESGKVELANAEASFHEEIARNEREIANAEAEIDAADIGSFYLLERKDSIIGYTDFYNDSERIEAIGSVFPLIFFGVAILVTLSTITQMIEDSRMQLGVYKALGYTSLQASLKYIGFAFIAWFIGIILGIVIGFYIIPSIIYNAYRILYETPELVSTVVFSYLWMPLVISFLSSVGIAIYKSIRVSSGNAANLLRPPLPKGGQRILLERFTLLWNNLSFLYKVSLRNLFRNKARFLMTIIGIGGCTGLLITGFGLDHSINNSIETQFNELFKYDGFIIYDPGAKIDDSIFTDTLDMFNSNILINDQDVTLYATDELERFPTFFAFNNKVSSDEIVLDDDSVVISEKIAKENNISVGDDFEFEYKNKKYTTQITNIIENYANHYLFMSDTKFNEITNRTHDHNMRMFIGDNIDSTVSEKILEDSKVLNVSLTPNIEKMIKDQMGNFDIIIYVVVIAAFSLELIVLTNLITMNMSERQKELATLKVLGFYPNELATYILRENIILTLISLLFGTIFGIYLHRFVIITAELDMIMFYRQLNASSIIIALVLTLVLSLLINYFMSIKANNVDMSEALKTFDA